MFGEKLVRVMFHRRKFWLVESFITKQESNIIFNQRNSKYKKVANFQFTEMNSARK